MDARGSKLRYTHQVVDGANSLKHYGLELAMQAALPAQLVDRAREIAAVRDSIEDENRDASHGSRLVALRRYLAKVRSTTAWSLTHAAQGPASASSRIVATGQ